jgi:TnpA family transposase
MPGSAGVRPAGDTWLNVISDQAIGLAARVVSATPRDSLHMLDVIFSQDHGRRPDVLVADTGSYSDLVFGLATLLGIEYRPELADLPDQRTWRLRPRATPLPARPRAPRARRWRCPAPR